MTATLTDPKRAEWTNCASRANPGPADGPTLAEACDLLAVLDPHPGTDDGVLGELLALAAVEVAAAAGIEWNPDPRDVPVLSMRLIVRCAAEVPSAAGPHVEGLVGELQSRATAKRRSPA